MDEDEDWFEGMGHESLEEVSIYIPSGTCNCISQVYTPNVVSMSMKLYRANR